MRLDIAVARPIIVAMATPYQEISGTAVKRAASGDTLLPWRGLLLSGSLGLTIWAGLHFAFFDTIARSYWLVGLGLCIAALSLLARQLPVHYPHAVLGACNAVTLLRGALMLALVTPLIAGTERGWPEFAVAAVAAGLDGVDGWLARRSGLISDFGARFDMETDSCLALVLALHALADGLAWPFAVILGASRFLFLAAMVVAPWLRGPLPERFSRKAVCALQIAALVALQAPSLAGAAGLGLLAATGAALAVLASFARDIHWLWGQRA
ncbi:Phosphatidylglycerophosphate synthase [Aliiruegeria lutimaris]|uniref:Phosphatidylglycerophosphate synthase n=2 Tax=Aliiruegeria lutimaris TaxID=571298 RepID=A0A1G9FH07_9RHOB|nr:Phosphatidylglycerophosphate synthase [Aliiruegeria lutimaris]